MYVAMPAHLLLVPLAALHLSHANRFLPLLRLLLHALQLRLHRRQLSHRQLRAVALPAPRRPCRLHRLAPLGHRLGAQSDIEGLQRPPADCLAHILDAGQPVELPHLRLADGVGDGQQLLAGAHPGGGAGAARRHLLHDDGGAAALAPQGGQLHALLEVSGGQLQAAEAVVGRGRAGVG
jgi:hypothetical protein